MSQSHFLDIKLPLGWLFTFYGVVLGAYGLFTQPDLYQKSANLNINLLWGGLLLIIGVALLLMSCCVKKNQRNHP